MLRKYIYGQTLERIAEELNYSPRHIQRILNAAVEEVGTRVN
ncbi:MAG: helix-turn-helix domain-containing protein [Clostridia bacterium]|nr:helix-turn-helix domain-containing protein [Clostridia bacterium]